jgi:hypothetical protein
MNKDRHKQLMDDTTANITRKEAIDGWHFCPDWDGALIKIGEDNCPCEQWTEEELKEFQK